MDTAILILHFVLAAVLIGLVILQGPKGEGLGAIGGSARLYHGPQPRATFFNRTTAIISILFALSATYLAFVPR